MKSFRLISILMLMLMPLLAYGAAFRAATNRPELNVFEIGEVVKVTIHGTEKEIKVKVLDEFDRGLKSFAPVMSKVADGSYTCILEMPAKRLGFYRVKLLDRNNKPATDALGSRPAGELTYAIVSKISERKLYPASKTFFGIQGSGRSFAAVLPYMGARYTTASRFWDQLERSHPGEFKERRLESITKGKIYPDDTPYGTGSIYYENGKTRKYTIYPIISMLRTPNWKKCKVKAGITNSRFSPLSEDGKKLFGEYCFQVAKAFREDYPELDQHFYQVSWEPHYPWGFAGTEQQLVDIYRVVYPMIHQADPNAVVMGPCYAGLTAKGTDLVEKAFAAGIGKYIDAISHHPYVTFPPEIADPATFTQKIRDISSKYTGKVLPLYATEQGFQVPTLNTELDKARGDIRMALILLGEGWKTNLSFYMFDYRGEPGYGYFYSLDPKLGWAPRSISPKAGVPAYAAMSNLLEGHYGAVRIDFLGEGICGYSYVGARGPVLALWNYLPEKANTVKIPVGVKTVKKIDWMGNESTINSKDNFVSLQLTGEPVYLVGASDKIWGNKAPKYFELSSIPVRIVCGEKTVISGAIVNKTGQILTGTVRLSAISDFGKFPKLINVECPPNGKYELKIPVVIPVTTAPSLYKLTLTFKGENGGISQGAAKLDVISPIQITDVKSSFDNLGPVLNMTLKNYASMPMDINLASRIRGIPGANIRSRIKLDANQSEAVHVSMNSAQFDPLRWYQVEIDASAGDRVQLKHKHRLNFSSINYLDTPPEFGGNIASWKKCATLLPVKGKDAIREPYDLKFKDPKDLSGNIYAGWNEENLYLAFEITDDVFYNKSKGWYIWNGDGLQIGVDLDPGKVEANTGNAWADQQTKHRRQELTMALTPDGATIFRHISFNTEKFPEKVVPKADMELKITRKDKACQVIYEVKIPWHSLGLKGKMQQGESIGLSVCIADRDIPKEPLSALGIFGGIKQGKKYNDYGVFFLNK